MLNQVDQHCLDLFPELKAKYSVQELEDASQLGSYIFHEDYFDKFVHENRAEEMMLRRVAEYTEHLASHQNADLRNLASIGILEALVNSQTHEIATFLGPNSQELLRQAAHRTRFDPKIWLRGAKP